MRFLLPLLSNEALEALRDGILQNGCYSPIICMKDMTLVGWHNRHAICEERDIPFRIFTLPFEDNLSHKMGERKDTGGGAINGSILENYVVSELMKSYYYAGKEPFMYYYRDKDTKEIDVLIEGDGCLYPIEFKKTASPSKQLTTVFKVLDKGILKRGNGVVLCMYEKFLHLDSENFTVPIWAI